MDDAQELESCTAVMPLGDLLLNSFVRHAARDAFVLPGARWTFAELWARASAVARGLIALGVRPGQHVGLLAQNTIEYVEGLFGIALISGVAVPINARHRTTELGYIAANGDLVALLTTGYEESGYLDFTDLLAQSLPSLARTDRADGLRLAEAPLLKHIVALRGAGGAGIMDRAEFDLRAASVGEAQLHAYRNRARLRDPAIILYTSGTTANPKGCVLSHEAMVRGPLHRALHRFGSGDADVTWGAGPLYHVGCLSPFIGSIGAGGTYVTDLFFEPGRALELMTSERASVAFPWFPGIMQPLLDHPDFDAGALKHLQSILVIGPRPLIDQVQATFPHARADRRQRHDGGSRHLRHQRPGRDRRAAGRGAGQSRPGRRVPNHRSRQSRRPAGRDHGRVVAARLLRHGPLLQGPGQDRRGARRRGLAGTPVTCTPAPRTDGSSSGVG